jgi:hypothetical protein
MVRWELDLWHEMWERAGSQGLGTWYDVLGRVKDESRSVRGSNADGLDGTADVSSADDDHEGQ